MAGGRILEVEPGGLCLILSEIAGPPAPDRAGKRRLNIIRHAEGLGDLAAGRAGAVADDGGRQRRVLPPIGLVDEPDHLLALLVLEVDIDVRRFIAFGGQEAIKEQGRLLWVHFGDAETEADGGIGGRTAALAENAHVARMADNAVDRQKIGFITLLGDQLELIVEKAEDLARDFIRVALSCAFIGEPTQRQGRRSRRRKSRRDTGGTVHRERIEAG